MNEESPLFRSLMIIEEKIRERLTVEMLAESIHFSKYHYQRIFREAVGDTVMRYVTRRRLFLAAEALAGTKASVLDIALQYGYDSHEGFTRSFKAYLGVTPTEYRKYHSAIHFPQRKKEQYTMTHSQELIKDLNSLIVQAKQTAADSRKFQEPGLPAAAFYSQFWALAAGRAEKLAEELRQILNRTQSAQGPAEISACLLLIKAIDNAAFEAHVTAFQVGLTISRAIPEHRALFQPLCMQYEKLAQNTRIKSGEMVNFFHEISSLIFQDMRKEAGQRLQAAVSAGRKAAEALSEPALPYGYIADEVRTLAQELDSLRLKDITLSALTAAAFRLDTIRFTADMDILRAPSHSQLFDGISEFREKLDETVSFFQALSEAGVQTFAETGTANTADTIYTDLAMHENMVLFFLKGEMQKLSGHLDTAQETAFHAVLCKIDQAIQLSRGTPDEAEKGKIAELLREAHDALMAESEKLGPCGGAIQYLAEKIKTPLIE